MSTENQTILTVPDHLLESVRLVVKDHLNYWTDFARDHPQGDFRDIIADDKRLLKEIEIK